MTYKQMNPRFESAYLPPRFSGEKGAVDVKKGWGSRMLRVRISLAAITCAAVACLALTARPASAKTLVVDKNSEVACLETITIYPTITAAITAAGVGDTIEVCNGTYTEADTITNTNNGLTIESVNPLGATIQAPAVLTTGGAIVEIAGATGVTINGFIITGPGPGPGCADSIKAGVLIHGGGSATVENNQITSIHDNPFSGCQSGVGIQVGEDSDDTTDGIVAGPGTGTLTDNTITLYQKGGILVDGDGSSATITGNTVTGVGKTTVIAQNGIEITETTLANPITGNTVTNNIHDNSTAKAQCAPQPASACVATAVGVLEFQAGMAGDAKTIKKNNTITKNQTNIVVMP
jgi:hypothetical protein